MLIVLDNTKHVYILGISPFLKATSSVCVCVCARVRACVAVALKKGLIRNFAHVLYCPIKISILLNRLCVGILF